MQGIQEPGEPGEPGEMREMKEFGPTAYIKSVTPWRNDHSDTRVRITYVTYERALPQTVWLELRCVFDETYAVPMSVGGRVRTLEPKMLLTVNYDVTPQGLVDLAEHFAKSVTFAVQKEEALTALARARGGQRG
jgi:hypothetical protein